MTITSWRTSLGGALSALGTTSMGVGLVPQLAGLPSKALTYTATAGFVLNAIGQFFTGWAARDNVVTSEQVAAATEAPKP